MLRSFIARRVVLGGRTFDDLVLRCAFAKHAGVGRVKALGSGLLGIWGFRGPKCKSQYEGGLKLPYIAPYIVPL